MRSPDSVDHGLFLPTSYRNTFATRNVADLETVQLPVVTVSRLRPSMIAILVLVTLFFVVLVLWLGLHTSLGWLGVLSVGGFVYSFLCASIVKHSLHLVPQEKPATLATQFHLLKKDTMNYLQSVNLPSKGNRR